jgi:hypothetical protein
MNNQELKIKGIKWNLAKGSTKRILNTKIKNGFI